MNNHSLYALIAVLALFCFVLFLRGRRLQQKMNRLFEHQEIYFPCLQSQVQILVRYNICQKRGREVSTLNDQIVFIASMLQGLKYGTPEFKESDFLSMLSSRGIKHVTMTELPLSTKT